jgi:hypothetical protein
MSDMIDGETWLEAKEDLECAIARVRRVLDHGDEWGGPWAPLMPKTRLGWEKLLAGLVDEYQSHWAN